MQKKIRKSKSFLLAIAIVVVLALLMGCSSKKRMFDKDATTVAAGSLIDPIFEDINLVRLLDPEYRGKYPVNSTALAEYKDENLTGKEIDIAFKAFMKYNNLEQRRNAVQEFILAASQSRCNYYKNRLQSLKTGTNFVFGSLTTLAGGLGAILSNNAMAARSLAGTSAILSGVNAEFNQQFFSNLAVSVIIKGIDKRRRALYDEIVNRGQIKPYHLYNVEAAVKDAI